METKASKVDTDDDICAICLDPLIKDVTTLKCKHMYHKECFLQHSETLRKRAEMEVFCPTCRTIVAHHKNLFPICYDLHTRTNVTYYTYLSIIEANDVNQEAHEESYTCCQNKNELILGCTMATLVGILFLLL